jgi:starvation-inducible DNA-binding protein
LTTIHDNQYDLNKPSRPAIVIILIFNTNLMPNITTHLAKLTASSVDFYFAYKYFHWNITGQDFREFHTMFDKHASSIYEQWDPTAERMRQLDATVSGSLTEYATESVIQKNRPETKNNIQEILKFLVKQHQNHIDLLNQIIDTASEEKDFATADLLTKFLEEHQQMQWFIKSSIE